MKKRILISLSGGGMKGYPACAVLADIERRIDKPLWTVCDLAGGCSIGGIVALSIFGKGISARDTLGFFTADGPDIFDQNLLQKIDGDRTELFDSYRYGAGTIEAKLQARLGTGFISSAKCNVLAPAVELGSKEIFFFKSYDRASALYRLWEAGRATSAAEFFFPPFAAQGKTFWDGGNAANNPAMCVYADAVRLFGQESDFVLLSLGCGKPAPDTTSAIGAGIISTARRVADTIVPAGESVVSYQCETLLGNGYYEIQPVVTTALDDASPAALAALEKAAADCIAANEATIDAFCEQVAANGKIL